MIDKIRIGYDIRVWPPESVCTADSNEWCVHEDVYTKAKNLLATYENEFRLLQITDEDKLLRLVEIVRNSPGSCLVAFEIFHSTAEVIRKAWGWPVYENTKGTFGWSLLGYDVCEISSLYSVLQMGVISDNTNSLFKEGEEFAALDLVQSANILVPSHSPFFVVGLLKG
jgi:hypothetical protein